MEEFRGMCESIEVPEGVGDRVDDGRVGHGRERYLK